MPAEKIRNNFIINLKYLLKKEGISSKEFAKKIGVSASTVSMWLCGNSFPRDNALQKISDFFGISLATLLDKKTQDEKNNETEKSKNDTSANILEVTVENIRKNKELKERTRMVREHLFKAKRANWRKLPKEEWWVEGNLVWSNDSFKECRAIIIPKENSDMFTKSEHDDLGFETWYLVDPETICEYTGLTDNNGKKIFENDICKGTFLPTERLTRKFRISYTSLQCRFSAVDLDRGIAEPVDAYINYNYKTEVIGNIIDGGFDGKESEKN